MSTMQRRKTRLIETAMLEQGPILVEEDPIQDLVPTQHRAPIRDLGQPARLRQRLALGAQVRGLRMLI